MGISYMFCIYCGKEINKEMCFCTNCGKQVITKNSDQRLSFSNNPEFEINKSKKITKTAKNNQQIQLSEKKNRQHTMKYLLPLVVVVLIAIIVSCTLIFFSPSSIKISRYLNLGQKYLSELNYEEAIIEFDKAIAIDDRCIEAYMGKLEAYVEQGVEEGLVAYYEDLLDKIEDWDEAYIDEVETELVDVFLACSEVYLDDLDMQFGALERGLILLELNDNLLDEYIDTGLELANYYVREEEYEEGMDIIDKILPYSESDEVIEILEDCLYGYLDWLIENHEYDKALEIIEKYSNIVEGLDDYQKKIKGLKDSVEDDVDYDGIYEPILDRCIDIIEEGASDNAEEGFWMINNYVMWNSNGNNLYRDIGYAIKDMSGDNIPELIIGNYQINEKGTTYFDIYALYTIKKGRPYLILEGFERDRYKFVCEGEIGNMGSSGATDICFGKFGLSEDGTDKVWSDFYFSVPSEYDIDDVKYYFNQNGTFNERISRKITSDEFNDAFESYLNQYMYFETNQLEEYYKSRS